MEDPGAAARLFKDFAKDNEAFEVKVLAVSGQMLGADQLDVLAKLPTRDQALSHVDECHESAGAPSWHRR
jgi:large subunit ribosomal protein L10